MSLCCVVSQCHTEYLLPKSIIENIRYTKQTKLKQNKTKRKKFRVHSHSIIIVIFSTECTMYSYMAIRIRTVNATSRSVTNENYKKSMGTKKKKKTSSVKEEKQSLWHVVSCTVYGLV